MSSEAEHIQLEAADTVVTVRERLSRLRGRRVLLIWSLPGKPLGRKLDLVLIQREAYRRAIQLALVSADRAIIARAAELNISCFPSVEASERARWKRGRQKVFLPRYHKPGVDLQPEDLARIAARIARRKRHSPWRAAIERFFVLVLLIAVIGGAAYVILPGATVEVSPRRAPVSALVDIIADPKANAANLDKGLIPAKTERVTVATTASVPASGEIRLDSVSAAGVVTFTNRGDALVTIPRGTILGTSAGEPILFETVADVVVPAGGGESVAAAIEARDAYRGSVGNVGAGMINTVLGALAERVSVINLAPAAGGGNRSVSVVAAEDRARLLESVRIQLQSLAYEKLRSALLEDQIIVIESLRIEEERKEWTRFSADIGTMTSELSLSMRAVVGALVVNERYAEGAALSMLRANLPAGTALVADSVKYARGPFSMGRLGGQVAFTMTGSAAAAAAVDIEALRVELAGLPLEDARDRLRARPELSSAEPPRLTVYPPGLDAMPILPLRIQARVRTDA